MKENDVNKKVRDLVSEVNLQVGERDSGFCEAIRRLLGADILRILQRVKFEDDAVLGASMTFEFDGNELCLEEEQGTYVSLKRVEEGMPVICLLDRRSERFKEEFFGALAVAMDKRNSR